ncbi:unnamed protein product [Closterium sp. NIES-54]
MRRSTFHSSPAFGGGVMLAAAHSPHSSPSPPPPPRASGFPLSSSADLPPPAAAPPPVRRSSLSHALGTAAPPPAPSAEFAPAATPAGASAAAASSKLSRKSGRWDFFRWADEEEDELNEAEEVDREGEEAEEEGENERAAVEAKEYEDFLCANPAAIRGSELRWGRESERMSASFSGADRGGSRMAVTATRSDSSAAVGGAICGVDLGGAHSGAVEMYGSNCLDRAPLPCLSTSMATSTDTVTTATAAGAGDGAGGASSAAPFFPRHASCPSSPSHKALPEALPEARPVIVTNSVAGSTAGAPILGRLYGDGGISQRRSDQRDHRDRCDSPPHPQFGEGRSLPDSSSALCASAVPSASARVPVVSLSLAEPYTLLEFPARGTRGSSAAAPPPVSPPVRPPVLALLSAARAGLAAGAQPVSAHGGLGGAYIFRDESCANLAIVKPADEEPLAPNNPNGYVGRTLGQPGLKRSIRVGEAAGREVAAYVLDHGGFAGVPCTALVWAAHPVFHVNAPPPPPPQQQQWGHQQQRGQREPAQAQAQREGEQAVAAGAAEAGAGAQLRLCSMQRFEEHDFDASEHGTSRFPVSAVHRMGILDVRLLNTDRHSGNILVKRLGGGSEGEEQRGGRSSSAHAHALLRAEDDVRLIPIDHGFCLPETLESAYFEWLHWPQVRCCASKGKGRGGK